MLETITLGLLCEGPKTGYSLKTSIENGPGVFVKVSFGSLYPLLGRLCQKGLATVQTKTEGARVKKYYSITPQGQAHFAQWLAQPIDVREPDSHRLAKIYFFDSLPQPQRSQSLAACAASLQQYMDDLCARRDALLAKADPARHYYKLSTLYFGIASLQQTLHWCRHIAAGAPLQAFAACARDGAGEAATC